MTDLLVIAWSDIPTDQILMLDNYLKKNYKDFVVKYYGMMQHKNLGLDVFVRENNVKNMLIWHRGCITEEIINSIRPYLSKIILFNWDALYLNTKKTPNFDKNSIKYLDCVFITSYDIDNYYISNGAKKWFYLLPPYSQEIHHPLSEIDKTYECDISFCFTNIYEDFDIQNINRKDFLIELMKAADNYNWNLGLYTSERYKTFCGKYYRGYIDYDNTHKLFYSSKINISIHGANLDHYINERCILVMASGGLLLVDSVEGIRDSLKDGAVIMKNKISDIMYQIKDILENYDKYSIFKERALDIVKEYNISNWWNKIYAEIDKN